MDIFLVAVAVVAVAVAVAASLRRSAPAAPGEIELLRAELRAMSERIAQDSSQVSQRLEGIDHRVSESQAASTGLARNIFETLGNLQSATTSVAEQAQQFSSLQDLLKAPKARGGLGEAMLEELLRQVLPPSSYSMQHSFRSGRKVDAVVKAGGRLVAIDSKFPMENFRRITTADDDIERAAAESAFAADVEKHIKDVSSRYIVPDEGTFDFAVMYVPAEGVYAEVLRLSHRKRPLFEQAIEMRVVPMSPLTLMGYLQTILVGLKCLRIEDDAQRILDFCGRLRQDVERFADEYDTLGKHLGNARGRYEEGRNRLDRFRDTLERVVELDRDDDLGRDDHPPLEIVTER